MKFIIATTILFSLTFGQQVDYADEFLNIGVSARTISLGRAVVAESNNSGGYLINPAATTYLSSPVIFGMYINQFNLADYYSMGISVPTKKGFQWGVYGVSLNVDNIFLRPDLQSITDFESRRDSIRILVGDGLTTFNSRESAITINISKNIDTELMLGQSMPIPFSIPFGMNIRVVQKQLYKNSGFGIGIDLGGMLKMNLKDLVELKFLDEISLGLSMNNIRNTTIYWESETNEQIPMQLLIGAGYFHSFDKKPIQYSLLIQNNLQSKGETRYGVELQLFNAIHLRFGQEYDQLQGGLGIDFKVKNTAIGIDYSFSNHDLGNAHRFGGRIGL